MNNIEQMLNLFKDVLEEEYEEEAIEYRTLFRLFDHRFERKNFEFFLDFLQKRGMVKESISLCEVLGYTYPMEILKNVLPFLNLSKKNKKVFGEMIKTGELVICPDLPSYKNNSHKIWVQIRSEGAAHLIASFKSRLFPKITKLFFVNQCGKPKSFFIILNSTVLLDNLEELSVPDCNLESFGVKCILKLQSLTCLDLNENLVDDKVLRKISTLIGLKILNLTKNKFTFRGLAHILSLTNLRCLVLVENNLEDQALGNLILMTGLERLDVTNNPISKPGIERLIEALPNCHVIRTPRLKSV